MSRYLMKYKGAYRLKADIDEELHDFPRGEDGQVDSSFDDIYIKCQRGARIYHYGHSTLVAYIPSLGRGRNVLKDLGEGLLGKRLNNYKDLFTSLEKEGTIHNIVETDEEVEFKFNTSNLPLIAEYLKPLTAGANISPLSPRNLPKAPYAVPADELSAYKDTISCLSKSEVLVISRMTNTFIDNILTKDKLYKTVPIKTDMRQKMLKGKEYIHSMGYWDKYLKYLKKELKNHE